ncbi:hypothetical protein LTS08_007046 [Lithohypha guttulata]|nr:hypothetical protein LTS08_007046 [Lithohypha guttulata]
MFTISLLLLSVVPQVFGCADHQNFMRPGHNEKRQMNISNTGRTPTYWAYEASFNWGKLSPDYHLCQDGTQQSPIALGLNQGLSLYHQPDFSGYPSEVLGNYYNWGYGPAFTFYREPGNYTSLPYMTVDGERMYMTGWHIHSPADHTVGGDRSKAEIHYVHYTADGHERAVVAIRLDPGREDSPFFAQFPPAIHFNDTSAIQNLDMDPMQAIREVSNFSEFWTYKGSLTSPPCKEGLQWFLARNILFTSRIQMQDILGASTFSARAEQEVWGHEVNV